MGYDIGLRQCGSINLAQSKDRMVALKRRMAYNIPTGLHCEVHNLFFTIHNTMYMTIWLCLNKPTEDCNSYEELLRKVNYI